MAGCPSPLTQHSASRALKVLVEKCSAVTSCWTKVILCPLFCSGLAQRQNKTAAHFLYPVCTKPHLFYLDPPGSVAQLYSLAILRGPSTLSPSVNKLSLCHVKHAAERRSVHTPTLCYRQTSAALFCCSTQSFPPVAAHSWCYYSFHSPAHLQAYVRSLLDFPASHIKDGGGGGLRLVAINHKTKYMPMKVCETHGQRNLCLHPLPLPFRPPSPSPALP